MTPPCSGTFVSGIRLVDPPALFTHAVHRLSSYRNVPTSGRSNWGAALGTQFAFGDSIRMETYSGSGGNSPVLIYGLRRLATDTDSATSLNMGCWFRATRTTSSLGNSANTHRNSPFRCDFNTILFSFVWTVTLNLCNPYSLISNRLRLNHTYSLGEGFETNLRTEVIRFIACCLALRGSATRLA
jgi:hypothetical protein